MTVAKGLSGGTQRDPCNRPVMRVKRDLSSKMCGYFPLLPSLMPRISAISFDLFK